MTADSARPRTPSGPWMLRVPTPDLAAHRECWGRVPDLEASSLVAALDAAGVAGRGGANFPLGAKIHAARAAPGRRRHVVVNLSEGEPASAKDLTLALGSPHLVLDGAALVAGALDVREIDLVVPGEHGWVQRAMQDAVAERMNSGEDRDLRFAVRSGAGHFLSGESSAVLQLLEGRENLPVTRWAPATTSGLRGRPTLLANAETFAQAAAFVLDPASVPGADAEPGTRLLTITRPGGRLVVEVAHGTPWTDVLTPAELDGPVLLGGYHGTWVLPGSLRELTVSTAAMHRLGTPLGAGVVLPIGVEDCPLEHTASIARYLAAQGAGRCGPCRNGLPVLADALDDLLRTGKVEPVAELVGLVDGRGACAHPDGTARLVRSTLLSFPAELRAHAAGGCAATLSTRSA